MGQPHGDGTATAESRQVAGQVNGSFTAEMVSLRLSVGERLLSFVYNGAYVLIDPAEIVALHGVEHEPDTKSYSYNTTGGYGSEAGQWMPYATPLPLDTIVTLRGGAQIRISTSLTYAVAACRGR